jgi:hypothetical protein
MIGRVDHGATGIADKATRLNAESLKKSRPNDKSGPQDGGWGANGPVRMSELQIGAVARSPHLVTSALRPSLPFALIGAALQTGRSFRKPEADPSYDPLRATR